MIPSMDDAVQTYTDAGGNITHDWLLEIDPLSSDAINNQSETEFIQDDLTFHEIYSNKIVSSVLPFINITRNVSPWLF